MGQFEYNVKLNNSPSVIEQLNDLPIKQVNGSTIYFRDVGHVYDGAPPQTNIVRMDGRRAVLISRSSQVGGANLRCSRRTGP